MAEIIKMPKLGFDMAEGVLVRWVRQVGEPIQKGQVLAEIETDKATVEVESHFSGIVLQHLVDPGTSVPVNEPIAVVGEAGEQLSVSSHQPAASSQQVAASDEQKAATAEATPTDNQSKTQNLQSEILKASPLAKKMAREHGVDLGTVVGSGPGGRIVRRDIEAALSQQSAVSSKQPAVSIASDQLPVSPAAEDTAIPTTKLRQAIGRRLVESKTTIPHFYVTHEYRMEALLALRQQLNGYLPEGEKLSVNDFIVKGVALALREFPNLNAVIHGDQILRKGQVNVGVAVTVPGGLLTVVVKHADQKPLRLISSEIKAMAARAREGKVKPEDVDGSTFSTSNLGMYDVDEFIAIINPPEAAILAIGSARQVPVVEEGQIKIGWRMKATLSVDHRISDGAEAAQFLQALAKYLEEPARMLL
ncbi:MAG: 2-oxo acid dehydrogenase subunit E2 [Anaerolineales bacterium]|nr:2-oxo acid dehydrogenase subunit E2 [Anaerolineales bacterium]MCX7754692.1 2-oxo acid dehydrogenase subunit E2 [Anaerolineales bacterium]MDW8278901.1 dihydrolipoamide acetyltransferase family protein [Anaerolineales bacterium]